MSHGRHAKGRREVASALEARLARFEAAVQLREPDRVPFLNKDAWFPANYAGITCEEYLFDRRKAEAAFLKVFEELGSPWDMLYRPEGQIPAAIVYGNLRKCLLPGRDLPPTSSQQFVEIESMVPDEYDTAAELGWEEFVPRVLWPRLHPGLDRDFIAEELRAAWQRREASVQQWRERGVPTLFCTIAGDSISEPYEARTTINFLKDLYRYPDRVLRYAHAQLPREIEKAKQAADRTAIRRVFAGCGFPSCTYISPKMWERFVWPFFQRFVEEMHAANITCYLHWDGDWALNLPYLLQLPRGSCIVDLDGLTDIFKAKEVLKGHMCIAGDVPAALLCLATQLEVADYCKKLIDVVGDGGGFILSPGCNIPLNAKPENVRAMIEAVVTHGGY